MKTILLFNRYKKYVGVGNWNEFQRESILHRNNEQNNDISISKKHNINVQNIKVQRSFEKRIYRDVLLLAHINTAIYILWPSI